MFSLPKGIASRELREMLLEKLKNCEAGLISLSSVRLALQEAQSRNVGQKDIHMLTEEVRNAELEAKRIRNAAESMARRVETTSVDPSRQGFGRSIHPFACCTPTLQASCQDVCTPCQEGIQDIFHEFRRDREQDIHSQFAQADAVAEAQLQSQMQRQMQTQQMQQMQKMQMRGQPQLQSRQQQQMLHPQDPSFAEYVANGIGQQPVHGLVYSPNLPQSLPQTVGAAGGGALGNSISPLAGQQSSFWLGSWLPVRT
eukprot:TRINITY_DN27316_c0_g1_i2.p1 TRINITY_DN27316_c0_g1~~TRINITY_DN27316_c0_g1_i2.p1  ORF type:complete len:256 (+),score=61.01 TRINITY_DN27316_c0_g1_i2:291-1058(+)